MFFVIIFCIFKFMFFFNIKFIIEGVRRVCVVFFFVMILYVVRVVLVIEVRWSVFFNVIWVLLLFIF